MADLDYLMRKLFMNFTVTNKKVTNIQQNSPFAELLQKEKNHLDDGSSLVTLKGLDWNQFMAEINKWGYFLQSIGVMPCGM